MAEIPSEVVFLVDVDNTLLDNDRIVADLRKRLSEEFGLASAGRYWALFDQLRTELGYADYLGALQRYRKELEGRGIEPRQLLQVSRFFVDYPFADRVYPGALDALAAMARRGPTVILSDGDIVFQPRKIQRSGLWDAVDGRVMVYVHKELMLDEIRRIFPARHYVLVDDKPRILRAFKGAWGGGVTTVFPRQGQFALDADEAARLPQPDVTINHIRDIAHMASRTWTLPRGFQQELPMNANTQRLHELGQSLWIDNISRETLRDGSLAKLIADYSVTGLTSNPTIFEKAMGQGEAYDDSIASLARSGRGIEELFFSLAVDDLQHAADLFRPVHDATQGVDGWVSLEVSPLLVHDTAGTIQAAARLHAQAARRNLFIKIPGTPEGLPAIEESIYRGVPINVTLLFSREQYLAAAQAYMRGIERRLEEGRSPVVESVASLFVSRWDAAVKDTVSAPLQNRLGIAIAMQTYKAYRELLASERWQRLAAAGAHPQRLLWASTGTKDPKARESLYVDALAAPDTVNTMPEKTLKAFAADGQVGEPLPVDGGDAEAVLDAFRREGVDINALAAKMQAEGGDAFAKSWKGLMGGLADKVSQVAGATFR